VGIAAVAMVISGDRSVDAVAAVSLLASVLGLVILLLIARSVTRPEVAAIAVLVAAVSPLDLAIARRAWTDGVLAALVLTMAFACVRQSASPSRRWPVLFVLAGTPALLVKESSWPAYLAGACFLVWRARSGGPRPLAVLAGCAVGMGLACAVLLAACGGFAEAMRLVSSARITNAPNDYMLRYQTGSPLYYLQGLWLLQPLALLGLAGAIVAGFRPEWLSTRDARATRILAGFTLGFAALAAIYSQKNLRFLSPIMGPHALFAALMVGSAIEWVGSRWPVRRRLVTALATILILGLSGLDVWRFHDLFDRRYVIDPATPMLEEAARRPIPDGR
jgi:hypothetical protein